MDTKEFTEIIGDAPAWWSARVLEIRATRERELRMPSKDTDRGMFETATDIAASAATTRAARRREEPENGRQRTRQTA
jgi:hypothetical protein